MTALALPDYAALGDRELARLCARRDGGAVRHLLAANNQRLFRAAWSILGDRGEAEEAVQSAYVAALAAMDGFEGRSSLSTWLTRITVNQALGRLRARRRRHARIEEQGIAFIDDYRERLMAGSGAPQPDAAMAREQLRLLIERAVAALPRDFRLVFVLRDIEGLSVDEAAQALGIAAGTVKTRLLRARRRLQAALAPDVRSALQGTFPFAGADCAALTEAVLDRLHIV